MIKLTSGWTWRGGLKTLTSNNAFCPLPQNFLTAISALASSSWLAVTWLRTSPVRGWSTGSKLTSWHTSVRRMTEIHDLIVTDGGKSTTVAVKSMVNGKGFTVHTFRAHPFR